MVAWRRTRGLTLVEVLVALAVLAIMAGILVPVVYHARGAAKVAACTSKLTQISIATKMYYEDHSGPPVTDLPLALADYVDSSDVFICPEDAKGSRDSYSEFFVPRNGPTGEQFLVGCPRHGGEKRTAVAFGRAACEVDRLLDVTWNGQPIGPGDTVTGGEIWFQDGSRVKIADGMTVGMLVSFSTHNRPYSIIWVPKGSEGSIQCSVTPGSLFEVVTPSAIAGVQGTEFVLCVYNDRTDSTQLPADTRWVTLVRVYKGVVILTDRASRTQQRLTPGRVSVCAEQTKSTAKSPSWGDTGTRFGTTVSAAYPIAP